MSFLKVSVGLALFVFAMFELGAQPALADSTISLQCSYDGYPNRAPFTVDVNMSQSSVTINNPAENLCANGCYLPPSVEGPWHATIADKTISWPSPADSGGISRSTVIDRDTGKAMQTMTSSGQVVGHVPWSCHVAQKMF